MNKLKQIPEFLRFVMVGLFATGLHYGIYFVLQKFIQVNVAYTLGYVLSFVANFYLTAYFTFGQPPSWKKAFGLRGGTSDKLSDTYRIVESLSAVGFFPSVGSHPSVSHCHSGKFFISEVCFQTKVISLRSLYDSEE